MSRLLLVVDMQNDFVDGSLGTEEARKIVPKVAEKIAGWEGPVVFTRDTHQANYLETQEGKNLPVEHCIEGTKGWEIIPQLADLTRGRAIIDKVTFGSSDLPETIRTIDEDEGIDEICLIGLCTDICVISNAMLLKAFFPEMPLSVDPDCCAGVTPESHERALKSMATCQIRVGA